MQVSHERRDDVDVLRIQGRVDSTTAVALEEQLVGAIDEGVRTLVADLAGVPYISSAGLRAFLLALKRMNAVEGTLVLSGLSGDVKQVFDIAGFTMLFSAYDDVDAATAAVAS